MNVIFKKQLPRRAFLRGVGGVVALPLLDAMIPSLGRAAASQAPSRMAIVYFPNGVQVDSWFLKTDGSRQIRTIRFRFFASVCGSWWPKKKK